MRSKIIKRSGTKLTLEVEIELDPGSMLNSEEQIARALNEAGLQATKEALEQFDTDGSPIEISGEKLTSKGRQKKKYQTPYGAEEISRHVYQKSGGGKTYVPLEIASRMIYRATPLLSKQVSSKYSNLSAGKVQRDLDENHFRHLSRDYIQNLGQEVGKIIEGEEVKINYNLPEEALDAQIVSIGRDGTTTNIKGQGYRETMSGTISFYNEDQERVHTIYLAQAPEYGKATFNARFEREIEAVKSLLKKDVDYIGLADGSADNWTFLAPHTDVAILDYWHACEYLTLASGAASKSAYERKQWLEQARKKLLEEEGAALDLLKEMKKFKRKRGLSKTAKENLQDAITYFSNQHPKMDYANYTSRDYPVGSGVTEAACKVVVKERCCQSGMRWKITGAQKVLSIRALYHSDGRWEQFWRHINECGFSQN